MAQVTDYGNDSLIAANASLEVVQTVDKVTEVGVSIVVAGQALDAFLVQGKFHPDAAFQTLYSAAGAYTSPAGLVKGASGDLTTQAVGSGWIILDTRPLYALKLLASSGNVAGSTVSTYAVGRK
jgi:hypothetical protein